MKSKLPNLPHPAILLDNCPQLHSVIAELEAGTYPQPDVAVWRDDLPQTLAIRLARATGATDEQIAEITGPEALEVYDLDAKPQRITADPATWEVAVTSVSDTERATYTSGKDAHRTASRRSMATGVDHATVTFGAHVTTYRDGIGHGPNEAAEDAAREAAMTPEQRAAARTWAARMQARR